VTVIDVINVYKRVFNVFLLSQRFFYFQQVKITQITFPNSSNIGNIGLLTIKNSGI